MTTRASKSRGMPHRTAPVSPPASRTPLLIGGGILMVVALAAIVAIALSGTAPGGLAEPARSTIGITGDPLPAFTDPAADPAVGQPLPTLTGTDLGGDREAPDRSRRPRQSESQGYRGPKRRGSTGRWRVYPG